MNKQETANQYLHHSEMFLTDLFGSSVKLTLEFRDKMPKTISKVIDVCAGQNLISRDELLGRGRQRVKVNARKMAVAIMLKDKRHSLGTIGKQLGGRDHSTVINLMKGHSDLMETDKEYQEIFERIEKVFE